MLGNLGGLGGGVLRSRGGGSLSGVGWVLRSLGALSRDLRVGGLAGLSRVSWVGRGSGGAGRGGGVGAVLGNGSGKAGEGSDGEGVTHVDCWVLELETVKLEVLVGGGGGGRELASVYY